MSEDRAGKTKSGRPLDFVEPKLTDLFKAKSLRNIAPFLSRRVFQSGSVETRCHMALDPNDYWPRNSQGFWLGTLAFP